MIIISWDVGVINLAYCVLEFEEEKHEVTILDWDKINLMEDRMQLFCCGKMKKKKEENEKICNKKATYYLNINKKYYGFCKTHLSQHNEIWPESKTHSFFSCTKSKHQCDYLKLNGETCGKNCKYKFKKNGKKIYYCSIHYKSQLKKKINQYSPQLIKKLLVKKYPTSRLQLNLVKKLDNLAEHFSKLGIEEVIIENQPSQKNPKMKSMANTLFDYFMIRGYIDKIHEMDIKLVRLISPSNKLKVNNNNTIEIFKANKDKNKKYKLTKQLAIEYTKKLLENDETMLEYMNLYDKKDDLCDAYLQGRYYLEFVKKNEKKNNNIEKSNIEKNNNEKNNIKIISQNKSKKKTNIINL